MVYRNKLANKVFAYSYLKLYDIDSGALDGSVAPDRKELNSMLTSEGGKNEKLNSKHFV